MLKPRLETLITSWSTSRTRAFLLRPLDTWQSKLEFQRYEWLGDRCLGQIVSERLFRKYPAADEGELSTARQHIVRRSCLAGWALEMDIGNADESDRVLCDRAEALMGSLWDEFGMDVLYPVVDSVMKHYDDKVNVGDDPKGRLMGLVGPTAVVEFKCKLKGLLHVCQVLVDGTRVAKESHAEEDQARELATIAAVEELTGKGGAVSSLVSVTELNPKGALQELAQKITDSWPVVYSVEQKGPPHKPKFFAVVRMGSTREYGPAEGETKRKAEENVALIALRKLGQAGSAVTADGSS